MSFCHFYIAVWGEFNLKTSLIHRIAVLWTSKLNYYTKREDVELQKMTLGMEIMLHNIPKIILLTTVSYVIGILHLTFIIWIPFAVMRMYASGLHAKNSITCTLMSLTMFVLVPFTVQEMQISKLTLFIIAFVTCLGFYKYAPADTEARPIIGKNKRAKLKKQAMLSSLAIFAASFFLYNEFNLLVAISYVYTLVAILPLSYKLMRRRGNNYEKYE